ncbi:hypothetical protein EOD39_18025 [Acipenser ruthenus]|uniref:Uncharacterized protein n=1 Tax=Acipenser ruthenus TaxID=7906 RepID=A0A444V1V5_ACIRT|nr:hypothetical protein EOD39_18025 [Acipenser ruthenus]
MNFQNIARNSFPDHGWAGTRPPGNSLNVLKHSPQLPRARDQLQRVPGAFTRRLTKTPQSPRSAPESAGCFYEEAHKDTPEPEISSRECRVLLRGDSQRHPRARDQLQRVPGAFTRRLTKTPQSPRSAPESAGCFYEETHKDTPEPEISSRECQVLLRGGSKTPQDFRLHESLTCSQAAQWRSREGE